MDKQMLKSGFAYTTLDEALKYDKSSRIRTIHIMMAEAAIELGNFKAGDKILDCGCGTGIAMEVLRERNILSYGFDISEAMLSVARQKGLEVVQGSFNKIPYSDNFFNGIISISSFQWVGNEDSYASSRHYYNLAASEFARVVGKGNGVIQFYPADENDKSTALSALKRYFLVSKHIVWEGTKDEKEFLVLEKKVSMP